MGAIQGHREPYGVIKTQKEPYGVIWSHGESKESIVWSIRELLGALGCHREPNVATGSSMESQGPIERYRKP